jgi:hypothetical protein
VQRGKTTVRWHTIGAWKRYGGGVGQQIGVTKTLLCYWALRPTPPHYRRLHQDQAAAFLGRRLHCGRTSSCEEEAGEEERRTCPPRRSRGGSGRCTQRIRSLSSW